MHQYAAEKGFAMDWHLMNAGRYAGGGAGLVMMESTKVERRGCGTVGDPGLWDDAFVPGLKRCVDSIRSHDAVPAIQLGHSGRKARRFRPWEGGRPLEQRPEIEDWELVSVSATSAPESDPSPQPGRGRGAGRALGPRRPPGRRVRLRRAGDPRRSRLSHPSVPLALLEPAERRLRRLGTGPHALLHRDRRSGARALVGVQPLFLRLSVEDDARWGPDESVALARIFGALGVDVVDCS